MAGTIVSEADTIVSDDDNIRVLVDAWRSMVDRFPGHEIVAADGVTSLLANIPFGFFNMIVLDRPCADADALARALAVAFARADNYPHSKLFGFCRDWLPPGHDAALAAAGLAPSLTITGMAADRLLPPRRPLPALDYSRVADVTGATEIAIVNAHAYGMPEADVASISKMHIWIPTNFGIIGRVDGRAVATAAASLVGDIIYIALVATEPDCHKRGYAEAVMREAIDRAIAAFGPKRLWLHATEMGRPVYSAMGFATGSTLPLYTFAA